MTHIDLIVNGAVACAKVHGVLTAGAVGIPVDLHLDETWDGLTPRLIATCFGVTIRMYVAAGKSAIPWECLISGAELKIGIDGWDSAGNIRIPTEWASCGTVRPSVSEADPGQSNPPTPEEIDQLIAYAQQAAQTADALVDVVAEFREVATSASETAQSVRADADAGAFDGPQGPPGPSGVDLGQVVLDPTLSVPLSAAESVAVRKAFKPNAFPLVVPADGIHELYGVTYVMTDGVCSVNGISTETSFWNLAGGTAEIPAGLAPGGRYFVSIQSTSKDIALRVYIYAASGDSILDLTESAWLTIPANATGVRLRLNVASGITLNNDKISVAVLTQPGNSDLAQMVSKVVEEYVLLDSRVTALESKPPIDPTLELRVEKLEAAAEGNLYIFREDDTEAYSKAVPADALKWATLDKIGGNVDSVDLVGRNLAKTITKPTGTNYVIRTSEPLIQGETYTLSYYGGGSLLNVRAGDSDSTSSAALISNISIGGGQNTRTPRAVIFTFTVEFETQPAHFQLYKSQGGGWAPDLIPTEYMLVKGPAAMPYSPYHPPVIRAIPDAIRSLPGYGDAGAIVDIERKLYIAPDGSQTDISDIIPDGFEDIEVEAGGYIIFRQPGDLNLPVANQETFMIKLGGAME